MNEVNDDYRRLKTFLAFYNAKYREERADGSQPHRKPRLQLEVEAALTEEGIISVAELQQRFRKGYNAIIKRGQVAALVEYEIAKEIVDTWSIGTKRNRERLEVMMAVFEEAHLAKTAKPM